MKIGEIASFIDKDELVKLTSESLRVNTVNPPGNERPLAEFFAEKMGELGLEVRICPIGESRANVVGILRGKGKGPALLYNGHLDTVPPGDVKWDYDPFSGEIVGDKIYGRGAADMKSGLAAMIMAAGALKKSGIELEGDLIIAGTAGEETDSIGAKELLKEKEMSRVGAILIGEPSDNELYIAEKGALWLNVKALGKTAHGSMPEMGINAILHMKQFMEELCSYKFEYQEHELLGCPTMNIGTIRGGIKTNVVPDCCEMTVDIRTVPGMSHSAILEDFKAIIEKLKEDIPELNMAIEVENDRPPVGTDKDHEFVKLAIKVGERVFKKTLVPQGVNYYTDGAAFVPEMGLPMLILGPGEAKLAHQPNEYVEIDKLQKAAEFYAAFAVEYLKK
ncbi:M20 family metallopeptidase [Thermovirga sp.]|uniref:M20 family metallopeptidase n=1 Tax=Thermovirga sp. TaxID=2699834 RepID=UPI0025D11ED7|nr:M20 family metallopeptidase [Thermovirga sp.]MBO8154454.1 M20 family metallopeptidase [Thermovirga sp.]